MRQAIITFNMLFTLARNYPMDALHDIECIYHNYLVSTTNSSKAEMGLDSVPALQQLLGCAGIFFRDGREVIILFVGELRR